MSESHLQVNLDGTTAIRKTVLWPASKKEQEPIIRGLFEHNNWKVSKIENQLGSFWKVVTSCNGKSLKLNLYISSVRDEDRQPDEFKMQLGNTYPESDESGWITLVLGIYTIAEGFNKPQYILSGYDKSRYDFSTNPSIRGTRTSGLQKAYTFGMFKTDKSILFRPEFIYYYIDNLSDLFGRESLLLADNEKKAYEQKIYFGTPGSGKSWTIKRNYEMRLEGGKYVEDEEKKKRVIRTTFHPDTDYAQFVGCYKPKTYDDGDEKKISYEFTPQAFTEAYVKAWSDLEHPYYLIIEEINRGNCAQIFGDLFQLLDRNKAGYSEYPIKADHDLREYLEAHLPEDSEGIMDGKLCLPPNLSIIASMNTSDQSLFPMDSAFKRRWSWEYVPIDYNNKVSAQFKINIDIDGVPEDWHEFLKAVNEKIKKVTSSEDKQMGNFFIKQSIDEKEFCDKVMFYLWSEVGKDNYQTSDAIFKYYSEDDKLLEFSFNDLYDKEKRAAILKGFIRYIKESES